MTVYFVLRTILLGGAVVQIYYCLLRLVARENPPECMYPHYLTYSRTFPNCSALCVGERERRKGPADHYNLQSSALF
jgi:hypothetical protein